MGRNVPCAHPRGPGGAQGSGCVCVSVRLSAGKPSVCCEFIIFFRGAGRGLLTVCAAALKLRLSLQLGGGKRIRKENGRRRGQKRPPGAVKEAARRRARGQKKEGERGPRGVSAHRPAPGFRRRAQGGEGRGAAGALQTWAGARRHARAPRRAGQRVGRGAGGAGPGEAPREGHRSGGGAQSCGCGEPRRAAPPPPGALAGLGRRRRLRNAPASPSARHSKLGGRCSRRRQPGAAGRSRRAIPASCAGPGGGCRAGPGGGSDGRALGSGIRAGPAAACPGRRARSAAAVTVCLCHVCAAGGDREPRPGSERGRGQCPPRRPPPPRDGGTGQLQAPQPHGPSGRPLPRLRPRARLLLSTSSALSHAGGSNTRSRDSGPGRDERVQTGSSPPFSLPSRAAPGRLGLGEPRGKRGKGSGTGPQLLL